jgi:hypothetical protein
MEDEPRKPSADILLYQTRSGLWKARVNFTKGQYYYTESFKTPAATLSAAATCVEHHLKEETNAED